MTQVHDLRVWSTVFPALRRGEKRCEWRKDDRNFRQWDHLILREWDPRGPYEGVDGEGRPTNKGEYTGAVLCAVITHIVRASELTVEERAAFQFPEGFALLSIRLLHNHADDQDGKKAP